MLYIKTNSTDAAYHFSVEEYIMRHFNSGQPVMMIWQAEKCVMLGNYQVAGAQVNMSFAREAGIGIVRRSSGGGAIFTDLGTLLYTMILPYTGGQCAQTIAKETVADAVVDALNKMGIPAVQEGRNDILLDGKKISGLAQYIRHGHLCTHGSLLYDTDLEMLAQVLNVDEDKIRSKAIRSVRSRVTNIKPYMERPCEVEDFRNLLKLKLLGSREVREYTFNADELGEIDRIYHEKYGNPSWTFESSPKFTLHSSKRFAGGKVEVYLDVAKGAVVSCSIRGDFLGIVPIRGLEEHLEKQAFQYETIRSALNEIMLEPYLGGITKSEFLSCIFD